MGTPLSPNFSGAKFVNITCGCSILTFEAWFIVRSYCEALSLKNLSCFLSISSDVIAVLLALRMLVAS